MGQILAQNSEGLKYIVPDRKTSHRMSPVFENSMIQYQLKLKLTPRQGRQINRWLWHLSAVWNWSVKQVEHDHSLTRFDLINKLAAHSRRVGIPAHVMHGAVSDARLAWQRCFQGLTRKPKLKGKRNKLNSVSFPDPIKPPIGGRIRLLGVGSVRYHNQEIPKGKIKCGRIVKRASGWYLCLWIEAEREEIPATARGAIGIDSGFTSLLTLSVGEKIKHPRELEASALRLAQAQRGGNWQLAARTQERIANQRKDRNHKLSRRLVSENQLIAFSADNHSGIARRFGKSVASSNHYQLRSMLAYKSKCRTDGLGIYIEVPSRNSTRTCSACGALTGPTGWTGLKVRQWDCSACGARHDRDINAAVNTLIAGAGLAHETLATAA